MTPAKVRAPRPERTTRSAIAVAGVAWQDFLSSQGVAVRMVDDAKALAELAQELATVARQGEPVALDFETTGGLSAGALRPRLVQLYAGGDEVAVADLNLTGFAPIACLAGIGCVAYGAGFESRIFMAQGLEPHMNDAALAAGLRLDRDEFQRDLATTWRRIKKKPVPENKKAMQLSDFSGDLTPEQIAYACSDAVMAFQVWESCQAEVHSRSYAIAQKAIIAVASMEMVGLPYDREAHSTMLVEWNRLARIEARRFHDMTGLWPSDQKAFRDQLTHNTEPELLETWPRTDTGFLSLSSKALASLPHAELPEVAQYLRAKALGTLITTFGFKLMGKVSPMTKRVHFGFQLAGARTGRMTSSPSGQNLPAGPYRKIFRSAPGFRVISIDYSAIELRAAALLAGETSLLDVFRNPPRLPDGSRNPAGDPHIALAQTLRLDAALNPGQRLAKALNFRLLFGTGIEGFAANADISLEAAGELIDRWRKVRPRLVMWQRVTKAKAKRVNYAITPAGRKVNCYYVDPEIKARRFKGNRALNVPIQGGCAEALMIALPFAYAGLKTVNRSARLIAAVHDELVFECRVEDVEQASAIVTSAMAQGLKEVFGRMARFDDIARYAVGSPKVGETWGGEAFNLASLSPEDLAILVKGLDSDDEETEEESESEDAGKDERVEDDNVEDDNVELEALRDQIRGITLQLLRTCDPRSLRLAFRQAGVERLEQADMTALQDLQERLAGDLPIDDEPEHCRLGPSSAARWLNCPGSVAAVEASRNYSSVYSHEGDRAHMALEWSLRLGVQPSDLVAPDNWPEVAASVQVAIDFAQRQTGELHVEQRFMIDDGLDLGGTADLVVVLETETRIADFKHGKEAIAARDNDQLLTYAVAARKRYGPRPSYLLVIIQPRAHKQAEITEWRVSDAALSCFEQRLMAGAHAASEGHAPRHAGAWCRWCPARGSCHEFQAEREDDDDDVLSARPSDIGDAVHPMPEKSDNSDSMAIPAFLDRRGKKG